MEKEEILALIAVLDAAEVVIKNSGVQSLIRNQPGARVVGQLVALNAKVSEARLLIKKGFIC